MKKPVTIARWQTREKLSDREASKALGLARNTYAIYRSGEKAMPYYVRLAVAALWAGLEPASEKAE